MTFNNRPPPAKVSTKSFQVNCRTHALLAYRILEEVEGLY